MQRTVGPAARRLAALLSEPRYRRSWQRYSSVRRGELSRAAVAAVLAAHLFETGQVGWDHQPLGGGHRADQCPQLVGVLVGHPEGGDEQLERAVGHPLAVQCPAHPVLQAAR
ncbi:MAG: uncharacterized protein JWR28_1665, partial [Modestobacter sp.]|nr:uncharacterized protein [Modestobacter sp.]